MKSRSRLKLSIQTRTFSSFCAMVAAYEKSKPICTAIRSLLVTYAPNFHFTSSYMKIYQKQWNLGPDKIWAFGPGNYRDSVQQELHTSLFKQGSYVKHEKSPPPPLGYGLKLTIFGTCIYMHTILWKRIFVYYFNFGSLNKIFMFPNFVGTTYLHNTMYGRGIASKTRF